MRTFTRRLGLAAVLLGLTCPVFAQDADDSVAVSQGGEAKPYLAETERPDMAAVLSPPPASGSPEEASDRAIFAATRALAGSPRWHLAARDANAKSKALLADFGCAIGAALDGRSAPALDRLLHRVLADIEVAFRTAKAGVKRLRPLVGNDQPICVERTDRLASTYSYPSGHATRGWTYALVLSELVPERATAILRRGRVYGESRVVCGVHWLSDVEAGRTVGGALFAVLNGNAEFRADLDQARAEMAGVRAAASIPEAGTCQAEDEAAAVSVR